MLAKRSESIVVLIDMQPSFLRPIVDADEVLKRCKFLLQTAKLLQVPLLATEQYPSRMGGTHEELASLLEAKPIGKMCFSCARSAEFMSELEASGKKQAVLIGIETPICVNQTAHDLTERGYEVLLAVDAVGGRSIEMHNLALQRLQSAGVVMGQTESIVYEWMDSAEDPAFRQVLQLVKEL